jgi:hypothetical protein
MSCYMCYNSIDENSNSLTAPIQNNGCKGIQSTIWTCIFRAASFYNEFCQQHKTIPDKKVENFLIAPTEIMNIH